MIKNNGLNIYVNESIQYEDSIEIGHCSIIGEFGSRANTIIGKNLVMGAFSIIENNVEIGNNCEIGNYCTIYEDSKIGNNVKILSGSRVYWDAIVRDGAIINGYVSANVIIEENVRFFGRIAHSHRDHTLDWETTVEKSPMFKKNTFIGLGALIVGAITIGENSYIAAGEVVRSDVPPDSVFYKGQIFPKSKFRGIIK